MGSNVSKRRNVNGYIRCGSSKHIGDRMRPISEFCKSKTPDGLSYSCKSCRTKENKQLCANRYLRYKDKGNNRIMSLLKSRQTDAKTKNLSFSLTIEDIIIPDVCPVLGIPLIFSDKRTNNTPSIDRIDNTKGYTKDNIVVCSWRANMLKKNATVLELQQLAQFYTKIIGDKNEVDNR